MELNEIKTKRKTLEQVISSFIMEFEKETGASVISVDLHKENTMFSRIPLFASLEIKLEI